MTNHVLIKKDLYLVNQKSKKENIEVKNFVVNTHHIFVIDCSGSMCSELSKIRKDLYNKISTDLKENDSLTLVWFSGRNQCGVILEDYQIKSNISLNKVKELIERYLVDIGLTAFKDPFIEVANVIKRVSNRNNSIIHSMFFLTDGYDNQYSTKEILDAIKLIKDDLSNSTIVEYGWYCNKELLSKMALELGGNHIFSEQFQDYEPYIGKEFKDSKSSKRKYVKIYGSVDYGAVFSITNEWEVINYSINENNEVFINEDVENFFYFSKYPVGEEVKFSPFLFSENAKIEDEINFIFMDALYASLFSFSRLNDYDKVSEIIKFIGDARLIIKKANAFGTQKINELEAEFLLALKDKNKRFEEGYNPNLEPKEDAYCVLDMIDDLMEDDCNFWYPNHKSFFYKRIGAKSVTKDIITEKEKEELEKLLEEGDVKRFHEKAGELLKRNQEIKFEYYNEDSGYPISDIVWNEKRANLSVQVKYSGQIVLPDNNFSNLPKVFLTHKYRNYTLIKDGVIHSYILPVSLSENTFNKLKSNNLLQNEQSYSRGKIYELDFSSLPVVNRNMIKNMSAEELFKNEYELLKLKANNTVFNHFRKMKAGNVSVDFVEKYGEDAANWLKEIGITANGFNPPSTLEKSGEEILVNSLKVKIDKLTLMTSEKDFQKVLTKINNGETLTPREALLKPAIEEMNNFMKSMEGVDDEKMIISWIDKKSKFFKKRKNQLMNEISKSKFLCIVGKSWFNEFKSRDEKEMILNIDGMDIKFEIDDKMETIKI